MNWLAAVAAVAVALAGWITPAGAVELIVLSSTGMPAALTDIRPIYEKKTHTTLAMTFLTANQVKDKRDAGAAFDVAIVPPHQRRYDTLRKAKGRRGDGSAGVRERDENVGR